MDMTMMAADVREGVFSDAYRRMLSDSGVSEAARLGYSGLVEEEGERLVRCVWFDQYLRLDALRTEDGQRVTVHSPGWWNVAPGPDFQNAELQFGDAPIQRTDVEVHICASDWYRHGHDHDPAYSRVGLHVVLESDRGDAFVVRSDGVRVPQLVVTKFLTEELEEIAETAIVKLNRDTPATPGRCRPPAQGAGQQWIGDFLDAAGDERILAKSERFRALLQTRALDDILMEGVMDALGYKSNRRPFRQLARRLPVSELKGFVPEDADARERSDMLQAILFGVAGLLPTSDEAADEETRAYVGQLGGTWERLAKDMGGRAMRRADWSFGGMRPMNRPERRIAAAAQWLGQSLYGGLFRTVLSCVEEAQSRGTRAGRAADALRRVQDLFSPKEEGYWARRCTFAGRPLPRASRLVGNDRASAMIVNVVLPLVLCEARRTGDPQMEAQAHDVYVALAPLAENHATRYVAGRVFPSAVEAKAVVTSTRRQQGLLQMYADFCRAADATCERCLFLTAALTASGIASSARGAG
jgi:hypothetical protein